MSDHRDPFDDWLSHQRPETLSPPPGAFDRISRSARRRRWTKAAGVSATTLAAVVGLAVAIPLGLRPDSDHDLPPGGPTSTAAASPQRTQTAPPSPGASGGAVAGPGASGAVRSGQSGGSVGRCGTGELRVSAANHPYGGGSGQFGRLLVFRNASSRSCVMYGFPGVSFVGGGSGRQVNDPFQRSGEPPVAVTLAPGGLANVTLLFAQVGNFDPGTCAPVAVDGYRVYPPDETAAVFVADPQQACSIKGVGVPGVGPVKPGAIP